MASILEYALSLKTAAFDNPLKNSESNLDRFGKGAQAAESGIGGLAAGVTGASAVIAAFAVTTAGALKVLNEYAEFDGLVRGMKTLEGTAEGTTKRIELLRDVAKVPGLGFEEAVKGDIRLRAVGISSELSEKSLRSFGNALATVGGGKAELDGVILGLSQIAAKGKVSAEEINQIAERVPQLRAAMKAAFGTADSEDLRISSLSALGFIEGITTELGKLPQVTGGARNALDNYDDSWKALKVSASEFGVGIAGTWIDQVSGAFQQARRDLQSLKDLFGVETPGLQGPDGDSPELKALKEERAAKQTQIDAMAESERKLAQDNLDFWYAKGQERLAFEVQRAKDRAAAAEAAIEREKKAQDEVFKAKLGQEADLKRRIAERVATGPTTAAEVNRFPAGSVQRADAAEKLAELVTLQRELSELQASAATQAKSEADALARKAEATNKQLTAQQLSAQAFALEGEILAARANGNEKLAASLEKQAKTEQLKLELMRQQGLSEKDAQAAAEKRIALEERAANPRRGLLDDAASAAARLGSRTDENRIRGSNTETLALAALERRNANRRLTPDAAAAALERGNANADPGRTRREEKALAAQNQQDPVLAVVREIRDKFANLASS